MADLTGPSKSRLQKLLKEYNEYPKRQQEIDAIGLEPLQAFVAHALDRGIAPVDLGGVGDGIPGGADGGDGW